MWLSRTWILLILFGLVYCEKSDEEDASAAFQDAVESFFTGGENGNGFQGVANAFVQSDTGKQLGDIFNGGKSNDGVGQIISGLGSLLASNTNGQGMDFSMIGSVLNSFMNTGQNNDARVTREAEKKPDGGLDLENLVHFGSMFFGQNGNTDFLMGLLPMVLQHLNGGDGENEIDSPQKNDHSAHSWYLPPILEHAHVMWDHFSNSELGQTLWKNSGLSKIVQQMSDTKGHILYEKILESLENPPLRRRWINSLTNLVAEGFSHVSDPTIQKRYLATIQFVGNSFLKSQGFPKAAKFDPNKPADSISRIINIIAKRYLGTKVDSLLYIKPAVAYIQELLALASEKGFIMSRVNARELANRLSEVIHNDLISPILKVYRAYKWSIKTPQCANQVLCTINERPSTEEAAPLLRSGILKVLSFPAAWAASNQLGINFWTLYGAIMEHKDCVQKYQADCTTFHEEEIRATTESIHSEL